MAKDKEVEFSKGKPQGWRAKVHGVGTFLWNGETKEFLGRNAKSWALIGIYYLIFYACLAGFFALNLWVFFTGISDSEPKLQNYDTLLKGHPGMGFRPMVNEDNTLIEFKMGDAKQLDAIVNKIDKFLEPYHNQSDDRYMDCSDKANATEGKVCRFDIKQFGPCTSKNKYGYDQGNPCVFLKLNKIYGWIPEKWTNDSTTTDCSKETCPTNVHDKHVFITCEGESAADKDFLNNHVKGQKTGDVKLYPANGLAFWYYPYKKQDGYLAPLVAAQFTQPKHGALIMILCKAWAHNTYHDKNDRAGSVHFELMINDKDK